MLATAIELVVSLLGALDIEWHGEKDAMVWSGGPVMPTSGWVLHAGIRGGALLVLELTPPAFEGIADRPEEEPAQHRRQQQEVGGFEEEGDPGRRHRGVLTHGERVREQ